MPFFTLSLEPATLALVVATVTLAGLVRGFAGFGAAMIYMPVASTVLAPKVAAPAFLVLDFVITLPLLTNAVRQCDWRTVAPTTAAAMIAVPLGAAILATADTLALRWLISGIVIGALLLLISGWRYRAEPRLSASLGIGALAGVLSGVSQVSGPPVVAFWLSGPKSPAVIRANLITFFALGSVAAFLAFLFHGFFTREVLSLILVTAPAYAIAIFLGARGFGLADPRLYRLVAYGLITLAAVTSLPALDGVLRGG